MSLPQFPMLLADKNASFWFPPKASTFAQETDSLFMYIMWISVFFFVLIVGVMVWFVMSYRRRPGYQGDSRALHNNALEITWTIIPTLIVIWIFARGVYGYMDMMTPPADTLDINVTASMWNWSFQYPNGAVSDTLHVPNNRAIRLRMRSEDVLHAFYVPAFRAKSDVVPGRVTTMWFQPILEGTYDLFCAEYCGDQHSEMIRQQGVFVTSQEEYDDWVAKAAQPPTNPVAHGYWLYGRYGCKSCHSVEEGKKIVGPSFAVSWGEAVKLSTGETVPFDENYTRESILEPQKKAREGYQNASQMPSFQGKLDENELNSINFFLKALKENPAFREAVADGELSKDEANSLGYGDAAPGEEAASEPESNQQEVSADVPAGEAQSEPAEAAGN